MPEVPHHEECVEHNLVPGMVQGRVSKYLSCLAGACVSSAAQLVQAVLLGLTGRQDGVRLTGPPEDWRRFVHKQRPGHGTRRPGPRRHAGR